MSEVLDVDGQQHAVKHLQDAAVAGHDVSLNNLGLGAGRLDENIRPGVVWDGRFGSRELLGDGCGVGRRAQLRLWGCVQLRWWCGGFGDCKGAK